MQARRLRYGEMQAGRLRDGQDAGTYFTPRGKS